MMDLKSRDYSPRTINRKLEVLKSFYRYHFKYSGLTSSPCRFIYHLKYVKPKGQFVAVDKVIKILDGIDQGMNRKMVREKLILELLYQTGCRCSEITGLKKKNIDFKKSQLKVLGKGRIERIVPISDYAVSLLKIHHNLWKHKNKGPYVFVTSKGRKIYSMYVWRLVRKYFHSEETGMNVSPHTLRHSIATHLYHNRAPLHSIKQLLGHRSLKSTSIYLHNDLAKLKRDYNMAHPKK